MTIEEKTAVGITAIEAGVWRHYKGGYYHVLGIGQHSESEELMVVYVSLTSTLGLTGPRLHVRPLVMWRQVVTTPEGKQCPRFTYVGIEIPHANGAPT